NDDFDGCHELVQTQEGDLYSDHLRAIAHRHVLCAADQHCLRYWIARFSHEHLVEIYSPGGTVTQAKQEMTNFVNGVRSVEASGNGVADCEKRQWEELTKLARILIDSE
ncbi:hypothetical protein BDR07DRAFT_1299371, partial [Suillus spraguei]